MQYRVAPSWRRPVASLTLCALIVGSIGCSTTTRTHLTASVPPPPRAENIEVLAVETVDGARVEFEPAAAVVEREGGRAVLRFPVATTFDGRAASLDQTLSLSEIRSYELVKTEEKFSPLKTLGLVGAVGLVAVGIFALTFEMTFGPGLFNCCS